MKFVLLFICLFSLVTSYCIVNPNFTPSISFTNINSDALYTANMVFDTIIEAMMNCNDKHIII